MANDYLRGLSKEEFKEVLDSCIKKVEFISDDDWQDIIDRYGLDIHRDVLRKAFQAPLGGYSVYRYLTENEMLEDKSDSKLEEIKELLGELDLKKNNARSENNKLRQLHRSLSKSVEIAEDIKFYLKKDIQNIEEIKLDRIENTSEYKLIVLISDWHIGYTINNYKGNSYNYNIAKRRLGKLLSEIKLVCMMYDIKNIIICQAGDAVENTYMRETQQAFECEFSMSEQVSKAIKLLYEFSTSVSQFANVDLISLGGNHSRISSKAANIEGDNFNVIIRETISMLIDASNNKRIRLLDVDYIDDSCIFEVNGLKVKAIHGDGRAVDSKKLYDSEATIEDERFDLILRGHFHNFNVQSQNSGGYVITNGCLFGYNPYSTRHISCNTYAGQTLIVIGDNEIESIKNVNLQFN